MQMKKIEIFKFYIYLFSINSIQTRDLVKDNYEFNVI